MWQKFWLQTGRNAPFILSDLMTQIGCPYMDISDYLLIGEFFLSAVAKSLLIRGCVIVGFSLYYYRVLTVEYKACCGDCYYF